MKMKHLALMALLVSSSPLMALDYEKGHHAFFSRKNAASATAKRAKRKAVSSWMTRSIFFSRFEKNGCGGSRGLGTRVICS